MDRILLGEGILSWNADERRSDRYGTIRLFADDMKTPKPLEASPWEGFNGKLVCVVKSTRPSTHCGDAFRGIFPSTPRIGEEICLGEGELFQETFGEPHEPSIFELESRRNEANFTESLRKQGIEVRGSWRQTPQESFDLVGLRPIDDRSVDWLDPNQLYRVIHQTVEVYFEPVE